MRRLIRLFTALSPALFVSCLMAHQYGVVRLPAEKAGNRRFDPALFRDVDARALNTPPRKGEPLDSLARRIAGEARDELEQVRAIWRWITAFISYDTGKKNYGARATLRDLRGTCQGYAELFVELARRAGLRAVEVTGRGRGSGHLPGEPVRANHAWNAVRIDGKWHLLDATYGAGQVNEDRFIRGYREHFFLTPPGEFIHSHLPDLRRWQLRERKISKKEFSNLPFYRHGYFTHGLRQSGGSRTAVIECEGDLALAFEAPGEIAVTINLRTPSGTTLVKKRFTGREGIVEINLAIKEPGRYYLYGWAGPDDDPAPPALAFVYLVVSKEGAPQTPLTDLVD
ncbi:MAG: hypothetical protein JW838_15620 [Spirochaetes bacterium]|nr:hypothetical protein [Spirochaetota bacterium]